MSLDYVMGGEEQRRPHRPWFETPACELPGGPVKEGGSHVKPLLQPPGEEGQVPKKMMSFQKWCSMVPVWVLRSRSSFSAYFSAFQLPPRLQGLLNLALLCSLSQLPITSRFGIG